MPKNITKARKSDVKIIQNAVAPSRVIRGENALNASVDLLAEFGTRPFVIGGDRSLKLLQKKLEDLLTSWKMVNQLMKFKIMHLSICS